MTPSDAKAAAAAVVVMTTVADDASGAALARTLVEEGLAACVTRTAVRSVYRWGAQGAEPTIHDDSEVLLLVKTSRARLEALERRVRELHAYECPEFVAVDAVHVEANYLAWLLGNCS